MAMGRIDNNIGKLRTIFRENGRGITWNEDFYLGSPAVHASIKQYQSTILEEQTRVRKFPVKVTPMFLDKLASLCSHLRKLVIAHSLKPSTRFILARDWKDFLFNQVFSKTPRGNSRNVFGIKPIPVTSYCRLLIYASMWL